MPEGDQKTFGKWRKRKFKRPFNLPQTDYRALGLRELKLRIAVGKEQKHQALLERYDLASDDGYPLCVTSLQIGHIVDDCSSEASIAVHFDVRFPNSPISIVPLNGAENHVRVRIGNSWSQLTPDNNFNLRLVDEIEIGNVRFTNAQFDAELRRRNKKLLRVSRTIKGNRDLLSRDLNYLRVSMMKLASIEGVIAFLRDSGLDDARILEIESKLISTLLNSPYGAERSAGMESLLFSD